MPLFRSSCVARDYFTTPGLGDIFVLKLAGFISEHRADLVRVTEDSTRVRVGGRTFGQWFRGDEYLPRTEIALTFRRNPQAQNQAMEVDVEVRPCGLFAPNFTAVSKHVIREIRGYFLIA